MRLHIINLFNYLQELLMSTGWVLQACCDCTCRTPLHARALSDWCAKQRGQGSRERRGLQADLQRCGAESLPPTLHVLWEVWEVGGEISWCTISWLQTSVIQTKLPESKLRTLFLYIGHYHINKKWLFLFWFCFHKFQLNAITKHKWFGNTSIFSVQF